MCAWGDSRTTKSKDWGEQGTDDCYDFNREIKIEADRHGERVHPPIIIAGS